MKSEKPERINVRLSPQLRKRLFAVCEKTGLDEPTAIRALVDAFCERAEADGGVWLPLKVVSKNARSFPSTATPQTPDDAIASRLNEDAATPRSAAVPKPANPAKRITKTRAIMRGIAQSNSPKP